MNVLRSIRDFLEYLCHFNARQYPNDLLNVVSSIDTLLKSAETLKTEIKEIK